jgi:putative ABC transport system permease protein
LSICGAVVFTILLVSANTLAISIRGRTREVSVLKTLGFTQQRVLSLFIGESIALALAGGILGVGVAIPLIRWLTRQFVAIGVPLNMKVSLPSVLLSLGIAAAVGFISGFLPAYKASQLNIVEGLRHIG